jgi:hypothetical protein
LYGGIASLSGCTSNSTSTVITKPGAYPITVTFTGGQLDPVSQYEHEVYRSDVPYQMTFTLNVQ